jgi:hypothetical protein
MTGGFCLPYTDECLKHAKVVKALLDVSANMGLLVGLVYLSSVASRKESSFISGGKRPIC